MIYRADTGLAAFFTVVAAAVQLVLLFCLWQGLLDMQRDAGITPPAAPAAGVLLLWYILLYVAAALFASLSLLLGISSRPCQRQKSSTCLLYTSPAEARKFADEGNRLLDKSELLFSTLNAELHSYGSAQRMTVPSP